MTGFGTTAFGLGSFGSGVSESTYTPGTSSGLFARAFDAATKDYIWDEDAQAFARWPRTRQRVWMALSHRRGEIPSLPAWGIQLPARVTESVYADVEQAVYDALRPVRECQIVGTSVEVSATRILVSVKFVDLDTGLPDDLGVAYGG